MYVAIKDSKIIAIQETEWECRRSAKGLGLPDYWTWLESVTTVSGTKPDEVKTYDFSGEDYDIVETKVNLEEFFNSGHIHEDGTFSLKWDVSKKEVVKDDTAKAAHDLAEEWKQIRTQRNRLLSESDWTQGADSPLTTQQKSDWAVYRTSLRTLPEDQSSVTSYSDINWPTKPS